MNPFSLRILIVEDDLVFAIQLKMLLESLGYLVVDRVDNADDALNVIYKEAPDLILMDIHIKGNLTGLDIGEKIKDLDIAILYITSSLEEKSYERARENSNIVGYLVKPVNKVSLRATIESAITNTTKFIDTGSLQKKGNTSITIRNCFYLKKREMYHKILTRDITHIVSNHNYCEIYTITGHTFTARFGIGKMESLLPEKRFFRTHRKYIVNLFHIDSVNLNDNTLEVANQIIPISRNNKTQLATILNFIH